MKPAVSKQSGSRSKAYLIHKPNQLVAKMEDLKMRVITKLIINKLKTREERIVCPCGYKTTSPERAMRHLLKHPLVNGRLDYATGAVSW